MEKRLRGQCGRHCACELTWLIIAIRAGVTSLHLARLTIMVNSWH